MNTNTAAAAATVSWCLIEALHKGKATVLGACSGAVAGLVAITPAAGFVTPMGAMALGLIVPCVCYSAILMKSKLGYDDSLDVFGVHGVGGMFGALGVGIFAAAGISGNEAGLLGGNPSLLVKQAISVVAAFAYSFVVTFVLLKVVDALVGLRVTTEEEEIGLDLTQHGERGYIMGIGELMGGIHEEPGSLPPLSSMAGEPLPTEAARGRLIAVSARGNRKPAGPSSPAGLFSNGENDRPQLHGLIDLELNGCYDVRRRQRATKHQGAADGFPVDQHDARRHRRRRGRVCRVQAVFLDRQPGIVCAGASRSGHRDGVRVPGPAQVRGTRGRLRRCFPGAGSVHRVEIRAVRGRRSVSLLGPALL